MTSQNRWVTVDRKKSTESQVCKKQTDRKGAELRWGHYTPNGIGIHCNTPQQPATCCNTLQHAAWRKVWTCKMALCSVACVCVLISHVCKVYYSVLQRVAAYCSVLHFDMLHRAAAHHSACTLHTKVRYVAPCYSVLQHTTQHCTTLHHTAPHCTT